MNTKKLVLISILASLGSIIGLLENIIPLPFVVPGVRLGLSNMVVLVSIVLFGLKEGVYVSLLKSVLLLLVSGNVTGFFYSFSGALLSSLSMALMIHFFKDKVSLIGVSLVGASAHNFAQVTMAVLVLKNIYIYSYLPVLLIIGLFTGVFVGISSQFILSNIKLTKQ